MQLRGGKRTQEADPGAETGRIDRVASEGKTQDDREGEKVDMEGKEQSKKTKHRQEVKKGFYGRKGSLTQSGRSHGPNSQLMPEGIGALRSNIEIRDHRTWSRR